MTAFEEFQKIAAKVPISLRNNRDRIELPILGLQEEAGKLGKVFSAAFASGKFHLPAAQSSEVKERLADTLWCVARLCEENGTSMEQAARHSIARIQARTEELDPNRR
jgi:NTP pyrophosphatase (non-canonical NTP hydrolase)